MSLAAPPSAWTDGRNAVEKSPRLFIVGTSSRRNCGSRRKFSSSAALSCALAVAVVADELMKPRMRRRSRASGASALSPLTARVASVLFCSARIRRTLSNCRSAGSDFFSARWSSAPLPANAGAELVEEDREALPVGQPHDVLDQVEVDRPRRVRRRQQVLALARPGRRPPTAAPAWSRSPAWAASARTRRSARRSATAGGSCRTRPCGSRGSWGCRSAGRRRPSCRP